MKGRIAKSQFYCPQVDYLHKVLQNHRFHLVIRRKFYTAKPYVHFVDTPQCASINHTISVNFKALL